MCKIVFMPDYKKIFVVIILFFNLINSNVYAEVINKIEIKGNERISKETIAIFGDIVFSL